MYGRPPSYTELIKAINATEETRKFGATQVNVELVLTLIGELGLGDEPITVGWALLSGTPLPSDRLSSLTDTRRRMLANARQIVPLASRYAWESALRDYALIPETYRNYQIAGQKLDQQIFDGCQLPLPPCPDYFQIYREILTESLTFVSTNRRQVLADESYTITVRDEQTGIHQGRVQFSAEQVAYKDILAEKWFDGERSRQPIQIKFADLNATAHFLDERERSRGNQDHWVIDLSRIALHTVNGHKTQAQLAPADVLDLDGFFHLAGIVSSGKTMLAMLMAAHVIYHKRDIRITLVVGDTNTAIQLANRLNQWFCNDPAIDEPVAVAILGQTTRSTHLGDCAYHAIIRAASKKACRIGANAG